LAKYKKGENKNLGFWFIVTGFWLKEKNQKQQTRDRKPNLYSNRAKEGVMHRPHTGTWRKTGSGRVLQEGDL